MFCPNCGKEIADNSTSCPSCGATFRQEPPQGSGNVPAKKGLMWQILAVCIAFLLILYLFRTYLPNASMIISYIILGITAVGLLILLISWLKTKL